MIDITITSTTINFVNGSTLVDTTFLGYEIVDDLSLHIITGQGIYLFNVIDCTFNGFSFGNSSDIFNK
jgi:hypothetical protein